MKLTMTKVLTPIAALAFSFGVQAAAPGAPETFDTYTAGTTVITNQTGWSFTYGTDGADDASAVTAYESGTAPTGTLLPDGVSAGANYLKLSTEDGILFRNMDGTATGNTVDLNAGLFVDTDVQFTVTDASDRPTPTAEDKFIIWLEDQGAATNLCAYALNLADGVVTSNAYTLVDASGNSLGIEPGSWHRLTVKAISDANAGGNSALPGFQVYLDGVVVKTSAIVATGTSYSGLSSSAQGLVDAQTFLPAMASSMTSLSKVGFSGEGAIDSVVVTRDVPFGGAAVQITWDTEILDYVELKTADGQNAFYESLTTSPATIKVDPGAQFKLVPVFKTGYSSSTHAISYAADEGSNASVDATGVVTASGAGGISVTTTPLDTVQVSFNFTQFIEDLAEFGTDAQQAFSSAIFKVNGTTVATLDPEGVSELDGYIYTIPNLKPGTNVTVEVTFSPASWTAVLTPSDNTYLTANGATVTVIARPSSGAASVAISATSAGPTIPTVTPGTDTAASYTSADAATIVAAINANKDTYITAPEGLAASYASAYKAMFVASSVAVGGSYKIVTSLTSEAEADLQSKANAAATAIANGITGSAVTVETTPGFYYSLKAGTTLDGMTEGARTLATGETLSLTLDKPTGATAGFYQVEINIVPAAAATEP